MATVALPKQHISSTPGVCGGKPCILGTRIRVQDIVIRTELGDSPDEILSAYPGITLADVHAALMFYYDNQTAIDLEIQQSEELVKQMKNQAGPGLLDQLR
ncbi:MAG TPA: DUF433 domain-containing protein [Tepidisphaeraceae bacterium]|jgi:uncharacterized protein (DUF433 family)|nr:DUF433 domain-containing protein [Tepidisphaeraceae bacterium]